MRPKAATTFLTGLDIPRAARSARPEGLPAAGQFFAGGRAESTPKKKTIDLSNYLGGRLYYSIQPGGNYDPPAGDDDNFYVQYTDTLMIVDDTATEVIHAVTGPGTGTYNIDGVMVSYSDVESASDRLAPNIIGMPTADIDEGTCVSLEGTVADGDETHEATWVVVKDGDVSHP